MTPTLLRAVGATLAALTALGPRTTTPQDPAVLQDELDAVQRALTALREQSAAFDDPLAAERARNQVVFEDVYLDLKPGLFEDHAGEWLVIAGGRIHPTDDAGRPRPTPELAQAIAAAQALAPEARQRYVFRVGEEGDLLHHPTVSAEPDLVGTQFLGLVPGDLWIAPDAVYLAPASEGTEAPDQLPADARPIGQGLAGPGGARLVAELSEPAGDGTTHVSLQVATGYSGHLILGPESAAATGAARWEIPGAIRLRSLPGTLRRSRLRVIVQGTGLDTWIPIGVRP